MEGDHSPPTLTSELETMDPHPILQTIKNSPTPTDPTKTPKQSTLKKLVHKLDYNSSAKSFTTKHKPTTREHETTPTTKHHNA